MENSVTAIEKQFATVATEKQLPPAGIEKELGSKPMKNSWQLLPGRNKQYPLMKNNF